MQTAQSTPAAQVAKFTPGPWTVEPATEGRNVRTWTVLRRNPAADPGYDFESMVDAHGKEAVFHSPAAARAAIAKATGAAA